MAATATVTATTNTASFISTGPLSPPPAVSCCPRRPSLQLTRPLRRSLLPLPVSAASKKGEEVSGTGVGEGELDGFPKEFYDEEWQARQREKTKEWHAYRKKEEEAEERRSNEYREIGMRLKGYPEEEVRNARKLVSSFIKAGEEVEEIIEEAAEMGELSELVLMVIWNRLEIARRDDEKDVIRSLDLLYRRIETEIIKRESTPSMRLLNDLLHLHDGSDDKGWLKKCKKRMIDTFPREDPFTMVLPARFDIENNKGRIELPPEGDDVLLRVDFVREVNELLREVRVDQEVQSQIALDPESVAIRLKQQEKQQTIRQVEALLELAISLKW